MNFDLNEAIELLITNPAQSELAFPYEREICLYQLRTWVFCPDPEIVEMAAAISGAKYLRLLERKRTTRLLGFVKEHTSDDLKRYLNDVNYSKIYDSTVGEYGGWCKLVEDQQRINLKKEVAARDEVAETVCRMIDYRFRYLDHGGLDRQQANISHSEFYRWKREPKISWKTIRDRWSKSRTSAVYLYVTKRFHLDVSPRYNQMGYFFGGISKDAADFTHIRRFFGTCAYISEVLRGDEDASEDEIRIPPNVKRIRPETKPLLQTELAKMSSYKEEKERMRWS